jgi:integrase
MNAATLEDVLVTYFRSNLRIRSEQTRKIYRLTIANLQAALGRKPTLDDLSDDNCTAMIHTLLGKKMAVRTINERRARLHALWTWLAKRGLVQQWPTTPPLTVPRRIPVAWTADELTRLLAASLGEPGRIGDVPASRWWYSLHLALWDTGERIGAMLNARWDGLMGQWLRIVAEDRKGQHADALYKLSPRTLAEMEHLRGPRAEIWHWPYCAIYIWPKYKRLRQRAGLPTDRYSAFHRMRRSVATHLEAAGGNATEALGHSSRGVTQKSYLDPRLLHKPQPADLLFRIQ